MNPPPLTTTEQIIDPIFYYIIGISFFFLLLITAIMLWFVWKYRRSRHPRPTSQVTKNVPLEVLWTLIPTVIALSMFYYGWSGYIALQRPPQGAMKVDVTARQWSWTFAYPNGKTSSKLYVPTGKPVAVDLRSVDVIHSFFIPAFRVKKDAVPGMTTHAWFVATDPGSYDLFCAEYCGAGHSAMITTVEALPPEKFAAWYEGKQAAEERGELKELLTRYGCTGCHSLDGSPGVGPTFKGLFGRKVTVVTNGKEHIITADRGVHPPLHPRTAGGPGEGLPAGDALLPGEDTGGGPEENPRSFRGNGDRRRGRESGGLRRETGAGEGLHRLPLHRRQPAGGADLQGAVRQSGDGRRGRENRDGDRG